MTSKTELEKILDGESPAISFYVHDPETLRLVAHKADGDFDTTRYVSVGVIYNILKEATAVPPSNCGIVVPSGLPNGIKV